MPIELRAMEDNADKRYIVGYALRFNSESDNLGGFVERIDPKALEGADMSDVRALFNHDPNMVLGRSKAGTLKLEVDELGLKYTIEPPDTSFARDLMNSMQRGDIDQSSFGFFIDYANDGDSWQYDENRDLYVRTITKFKEILDVSPVTYPAYRATESVVAQRGLENYKMS
jgi:HK97 family phage prohead protease